MRIALALTAIVASLTLPLAAQNAPAWDAKFRALPDAKNIGDYMKRMSARPHHLGSPYDKDNAEWILSKFREWGGTRASRTSTSSSRRRKSVSSRWLRRRRSG